MNIPVKILVSIVVLSCLECRPLYKKRVALLLHKRRKYCASSSSKTIPTNLFFLLLTCRNALHDKVSRMSRFCLVGMVGRFLRHIDVANRHLSRSKPQAGIRYPAVTVGMLRDRRRSLMSTESGSRLREQDRNGPWSKADSPAEMKSWTKENCDENGHLPNSKISHFGHDWKTRISKKVMLRSDKLVRFP